VRLPEADVYAALDPHQRRLLFNFNDVASAIRRDLWRRHPFPRTPFGEDVLMARALLEAGYTVVYDADAAVEHSHDHDARETRARAEADGRFNAEWLDRICIESRADARTLARRLAEADHDALRSDGVGGPEARWLEEQAAVLREVAFTGLYEGGTSRRRRAATRMRDTDELHVLYVVHGFPPDTWAGTEVYTLNLARELTRRGHRCTIFARVPAASDEEPDFEISRGELEGLSVYRMTHRLDHGRLSESYRQPRAERAFRAVLDEVRPDLVHFQHLIHTSAGLVHVARERGLPTVVHCHDYWALCARVQLIRPDGVRCDENMGLGCLACVKERRFDSIPRWKALGDAFAPTLDAAASVASRGWFGAGLAQRAGAYRDMRDRGPYVLGAYAACDLAISPSRFLRDKLLASGAFDPHDFLYSDNGMRTDHVRAIEKRPDPEGRVRFGFIGSLVWYKGGEVLVRAMNRLVSGAPRAVLSFHGDFRPDEDEHHRCLRELAGPGIEFRGRFDNARLAEVYAEIDVLVVPSTWFENSPITIHEAYLFRTPVVASDIGGMAEYVRDGIDGLLFPAGDDEALAACLRRFVDEPGLADELSRDFPPVKTIAEDAAVTEARYRALCCVVRTERFEDAAVGLSLENAEPPGSEEPR
jgi:glycosyltransferase involved in cell wall biosynthesis